MENFKEEELKVIIKDIARKHGFSENILLNIIRGDGKLKGFMSEIVTIYVKDENSKEELHLIAKISVKDEKVREVTSFEKAYENEITFYQTLAPAMKKLQHVMKIPSPFSSIAEFYAASSTKMGEYLLLENLQKSNFATLELNVLLDHEHVKYIFERYGEFHALSFALKILEPQQFHTLSGQLNNVWYDICIKRKVGRLMLDMLVGIEELMKEKGIELSLLNYYTQNYSEIMKNMVNHDEEKYACLLHGDCWSNNLMFKYKTTCGIKKLKAIKLIDFQFCNIGPPVHDLSYSIYSGATEEVLNNLDVYLRIYHESFSKFLGYFNLDADSVYPFKELKKQWKKYFHFGAILGSVIFKMRSMQGDHSVESLTTVSDDATYLDGITKADCDKEHLYPRIQILYRHFDKILNDQI